MITYENIPNLIIDKLIDNAFDEDLGRSGDLTSKLIIPDNTECRAQLISGDDGIIGGLLIGQKVWARLDPKIEIDFQKEEGNRVEKNQAILQLEGKAQAILGGERVALNFIQHLSGIATLTAKYVEIASRYKVKIFDTRKTLPGFRFLEKYAVMLGGGENHRLGLYDGIFIKDNHLKLTGGIRRALKRLKTNKNEGHKIIVEVENIEELKEAIGECVDIIVLDNMSPRQVREAVEINSGKTILEASGGINLNNLKEYLETGVNRISTGAITQSAPAFSVSLEIFEKK